MSKEQLETNKAALELLLSENTDKRTDYEAQLAQIEKDLKDLGKIALPPMVFDDIYEAIDSAVCQYDFSDSDNYNIEYGIEYDGKVYAESIELQHNSDLIESIVAKVSKIFTEMDCPEDEPTANEIAQKADEACN